MSAAFETLLAETRAVHDAHPEVRDFCPFATDLTPGDMKPAQMPAAALMAADPGLTGGPYSSLIQAVQSAAPEAQWRDTYKEDPISDDFRNRFGVYGLICGGGYKHSLSMAAFFVYMPAHLHYPMHQHPAEELYLVLAGEAEFSTREGPKKTLKPGDTVFHASNQPHATTTNDAPLLAYVLWRNELNIKPVWSKASQT